MSNIEHPEYYQSGNMEALDIIDEFNLNFYLGNVIKYIIRSGKKNKNTEIEDLKKAVNYLNLYIMKKESNLI